MTYFEIYKTKHGTPPPIKDDCPIWKFWNDISLEEYEQLDIFCRTNPGCTACEKCWNLEVTDPERIKILGGNQ